MKLTITVTALLLNEIFPRFGAPLEQIMDHEYSNEPYSKSPLNDFIDFSRVAKLSEGENENWDLVLNQSLATIIFSINGSNKFSYYTLFGQDVVIPIIF